MKLYNIWCIIALSEEANPDKGIKYRHAWNVVRIDGQYYHLDATFDNTLSRNNLIRYDYVNLSDKQIFRDHEPVIWKVPVCSDSDHFYYKEKKISWTTMDTVQSRTKQAVKKEKILLFHWRGGYLTREVLKELLEYSTKKHRPEIRGPMFLSTGRRPYCRYGFVQNGIGQVRYRWKWKRQNEGREGVAVEGGIYMFKKAFWVPYEDSANYPTLAKTMEAISKYCEENGETCTFIHDDEVGTMENDMKSIVAMKMEAGEIMGLNVRKNEFQQVMSICFYMTSQY